METIIENENTVSTLVKQSGLEQETALSLQQAFEPFLNQANEWKEKAFALVITDVTQVKEMKEADEARKAVKKLRNGVENRRKELKEDSLKKGKAIDTVANALKGLLEPIEAHLELQASYAERMENEAKDKIEGERKKQLEPFGTIVTFYNLRDMDEESFAHLYDTQKIAFEKKQEDARIAKEQEELKAKQQQLHNIRRIEIAPYLQFSKDAPEFLGAMSDEDFAALMQQLGDAKLAYDNEQAAIRAENERLQAEAKKREQEIAAKNQLRNERNAILRKYNATPETDMAELTEEEFSIRADFAKAAFEESERAKIAAEQKAAEERAERERLAAELKAKEDAEAKRIADEAATKEAELAKGDAEKMESLQADIEALKTKYTFKSAKHRNIQKDINLLLDKVVNHIIGKQ